MKNLKINTLIISILSILLFSSCSKKSKTLLTIPQDAVLVTSIDFKNLAIKAKLNKIEETNYYKIFRKEIENESPEINSLVDKIIDNPTVTGIDFFTNSYIFVTTQTKNQGILGFVAGLKSSDKFEDFLNEISKATGFELDIEVSENYSILNIPGEKNTIIGWDSERLLIISNIQKNSSNPEGENNIKSIFEKSMLQEKKTSILANNSFNNFVDKTSDLSVWISLKYLGETILQNGLSSYTQGLKTDYINDSYLNAHLTFDKGEVKLNLKADLKDKIFDKIANKNIINKDFEAKILDYIPNKSIAFASIGISLEQYYINLLQMPEIAFLAGNIEDEFNKEFGFTFSDFIKSFGGEYVFSLSDIELQKNEQLVTKTFWTDGYYDKKNKWHEGEYKSVDTLMINEKLVPIFSFATSFENESIFTDFMLKMPQDTIIDNESFYTFEYEGFKLYSTFNNGIVIITNDKNVIDKSNSGGYGAESLAKSDFAENIIKNYGFMFFDLNYENYPESVKTELQKNTGLQASIFNGFSGFYKQFTVKATDLENVETILELSTKEENSLFTIIDSFDKNIEHFTEL